MYIFCWFGVGMKFIKKNFLYILIILISIFLCLLIREINNNSFQNRRESLLASANLTNQTSVQFIIDEINELRQYNDDETVKQIIHDQIDKREVINNRYMWINEVINWDGGPEFAIRYVNQNLIEDEGSFLDTSYTDLAGDFPYRQQLEGVKEHNELFYSYYFKNYKDDHTVALKHSYVKLYKDYNWIIGCGIPDADLFRTLNIYENMNRNTIFISNFAILVAAFIFCITIYERKKRDREAIQLKIDKSSAYAKSEAKTEFLSTISHELRTPLNAIIGLNELLFQNSEDKTQVIEYSKKIDESSRMLLSLINDVLDMSAIEKGKLKIANEDFNVNILIHSVSDIYYNLSQKKNLEFVLECYDIKYELLVGDSYRIRQIVLNLLSNSLKFTQKGKIVLKVTEEFIGEDVFLSLVVTDTGCGMDEDTILRIFDQFEQADASVVRKYGGSGLGLSITKHLIDSMKGSLEVDSTVGSGSTFAVKVPLKVAKNKFRGEFNNIRQKLLFIGRNESTIKTLKLIFDDWNISYHIIQDVDKALQLLENEGEEYNTFIIDANDKSYDYLEISAKIKQVNNTSNIVMITDYNVIEVRNNNIENVDYLIQRPFIRRELFTKLAASYCINCNEGSEFKIESLKGLSILLVDDNKINLLVASNLLTSIGIKVTTLENGKDAVNFIKAHEFFDLVLMDIRMPVMDGLTATKLIREFNKDIPIIALSANAFEEDVLKSKQAGMNYHISKPIDKNQLYKIIAKYVTNKE
jgi:signal transduction histidine kinase/CheY-like chemotaxis protein